MLLQSIPQPMTAQRAHQGLAISAYSSNAQSARELPVELAEVLANLNHGLRLFLPTPASSSSPFTGQSYITNPTSLPSYLSQISPPHIPLALQILSRGLLTEGPKWHKWFQAEAPDLMPWGPTLHITGSFRNNTFVFRDLPIQWLQTNSSKKCKEGQLEIKPQLRSTEELLCAKLFTWIPHLFLTCLMKCVEFLLFPFTESK